MEGPKAQPRKSESAKIETPKDIVEQIETKQPHPEVEETIDTKQPEENTFMGRNTALEKATDGTPLELRKNIGSLVERMKGLTAVSRREVANATPRPTRVDLVDGIGTLDYAPSVGLNLSKYDKFGNDTTAPKEEPLLGSSLKLMELAEKAGVAKERTAMQTAEKEYLAKYKEFYAKNNVLTRLSKTKFDYKESKELDALKKEYNNSRLEYANAISSAKNQEGLTPTPSFTARKQKEFDELYKAGKPAMDAEKNNTLTFEEFLKSENTKRLEKIANYARFREVIKPAAEKKIQARAEALNEKGLNAFQKGLVWMGKKNEDLENTFGKTGAKVVKAMASTVVLGAGAAAVGTFGSAPLLALAGWGTLKFGKSFIGSLVGAAAGEFGAAFYEKHIGLGKKQKAKKALRQGTNPDIISAKDLRSLDKDREILLGKANGTDLEKKKALIKVLSAFVGVGASGAIQELEYFSHASHVVQGIAAPPHHVSAPTEHMPKPGAHAAAEHAPLHHHHHINNHHRFAHHPHASAGHEESVPKVSDDEITHKIQTMEADGSGFATPEAHEHMLAMESGNSATPVHVETLPDHVITPDDSVQLEHPNVQFEPDTTSTHDIPVNHHGVSIDNRTGHLYEMKDASTGKNSLAFFGNENDVNSFYKNLESMARANPGKEIYFNSPVETEYNGTNESWINVVKFTPSEGYVLPVTPPDSSLVGAKISSENFVRQIN